MPIDPAEIARIKKTTDLPTIARSHGITLTRMGKDLAGRCPFHEDDSPSLKLTEKPEGWLYHCFGCGRGGDCYTFVMEIEGVTFPVAHEMLMNGYVSGDREVGRPQAAPTADMSEEEMLKRITEYYHQTLLSKAGEAARAYLKKRGIYNEEMIRKFKIGFCDRSLGKKIPGKQTADGALIRKKLSDIGILRKNSGHEHFRGCIVVPVMDEAGEVGEVYGRKIAERLPKETPLHLYLPGPHKGIWNPECLSSPEIILCESLIDALTWVCHGFQNVTAAYGAGGLNNEILGALKASLVKVVYLAYDNDEAGDRAAERDSKRLSEIGIESYRVQFPKGMDANEYALKVQPARNSLEMALETATKMDNKSDMSGVLQPSPSPSINRDGHGKKDGGDFYTEETTKGEKPERAAGQINSPSENTLPSEEKPSQINQQPPSLDAPSKSPLVEVKDDTVYITLGDRVYRILGLYKNNSLDAININILVKREEKYHQDIFNFASHLKRKAFIQEASVELELEPPVIKSDVGKLFFELEGLLQSHIESLKTPTKEPAYKMTEEEEKEALAFLKRPDLLEEVARHFEVCGIVGEKTNCQALWFGGNSRHLNEPLMFMIQSLSGSGKTTMMEALLAFIPEEHKILLSAMTGQSLYYLDGVFVLSHKILAIAEEEGLEKVEYALKTLQSEGVLTIASTGRDPRTGLLVTHFYKVKGPAMIIFPGTSAKLNEELLNRSIILFTDISPEADPGDPRHAAKNGDPGGP